MCRLVSLATLALAIAGSAHAQYDQIVDTSVRYPRAMVDDVNRPGFNGRLYVRRPVIGGVDAWAVDSGDPGAEYYGAYGSETATIGLVIDPLDKLNAFDYGIISPWQVANDKSNRGNPTTNAFNRPRDKAADRLEAARQIWLNDNGLSGGVRTHVNDATLFAPAERRDSSLPTPRATIQIPDGEPRLRRNMHVQGPARISLPPNASAEIVQHISRTGGVVNAPSEAVVRIAIKD